MNWIVRSGGKLRAVTVAPPGVEPIALTPEEAMQLAHELQDTAEMVRRAFLSEAYATSEEAEAARKRAEEG